MVKGKKILARANGSNEIGLGHIYRLIALCSYFSDETSIEFLINQECPQIIPTNFKTRIQPTLNEKEELEFIKKNYPVDDWLILLDGYNFDLDYQKVLSLHGFNIVFVDDLLAFEQQADLLINPSLGVLIGDYLTARPIPMGLGVGYSPLRTEFLDYASVHSKLIKTKANKVFLSFGGSDFHNYTAKLLNFLESNSRISKIEVVVGKANLNVLAAFSSNSKIAVHAGLTAPEMLSLMSACDLAICSASTICYELACARVPLIIGWYAENQQKLYEGLIENKLAIGIGPLEDVNQEDLFKHIQTILDKESDSLIKQQALFFDGLNKQRIRKLIEPLLVDFNLRNATLKDLELMFKWANDKDVRGQSLSPDPIVFDNHKSWYSKKLDASDSYIYIATSNGLEVGQIRFDWVGNYFEIDYSIATEARGQGLGTRIVELGVKELFKEKGKISLKANVKKMNFASQKVFERLGFSRFDQEEDSLLTYVWEIE